MQLICFLLGGFWGGREQVFFLQLLAMHCVAKAISQGSAREGKGCVGGSAVTGSGGD